MIVLGSQVDPLVVLVEASLVIRRSFWGLELNCSCRGGELGGEGRLIRHKLEVVGLVGRVLYDYMLHSALAIPSASRADLL